MYIQFYCLRSCRDNGFGFDTILLSRVVAPASEPTTIYSSALSCNSNELLLMASKDRTITLDFRIEESRVEAPPSTKIYVMITGESV